MISKIKPAFNQVIESAVKPISKNWNPNVITVLSIFTSIITLVLFAKGFFLLGALSMTLYVFDLLDGAVARIHKKESKFGGYLDAVCDRFADGMIFLGLALSGNIRIDLCILALIGGFMVSYTKAKGEVVISSDRPGTNELSIGYAERAERLALIFVFAILFSLVKKEVFGLNIMEVGLVILITLSALTSVIRIKKVADLLR